jgi:hypothetical protein
MRISSIYLFIALFFIARSFHSSAYSQSRVYYSYMSKVESQHIMSNYFFSQLPKEIIYSKNVKNVTDCSFDRLMKVFSIHQTRVIKVYSMMWLDGVYDSIRSFDIDLSEQLVPYASTYFFFELDSFGNYLKMFETSVGNFDESMTIICDNRFETEWKQIYEEFKKREWDLYDMQLYSMSKLDGYHRKLIVIICYKGISYLLNKEGKIIKLKDYLIANFTPEEFFIGSY